MNNKPLQSSLGNAFLRARVKYLIENEVEKIHMHTLTKFYLSHCDDSDRSEGFNCSLTHGAKRQKMYIHKNNGFHHLYPFA